MHCAPASSCKNSFEPRNYIRAVAYRVAALKAENKRTMAENPRWISATEYSPCPLPIAWRQPIRVSVQPCSLTLVKTVLDRITEPARRFPNSIGTTVFLSTIHRRLFHGISRALAFFLSRSRPERIASIMWEATLVLVDGWHPFVGLARLGWKAIMSREENNEWWKYDRERKEEGWNRCEDILIDLTLIVTWKFSSQWMKYRLFLMVEPLLIIIFDFIHIANYWFKKKLLTKKRREFDWEVKIMSITYAREIKIRIRDWNWAMKFAGDEFSARSEKLYGFSAFSLMRANISNRGK